MMELKRFSHMVKKREYDNYVCRLKETGGDKNNA